MRSRIGPAGRPRSHGALVLVGQAAASRSGPRRTSAAQPRPQARQGISRDSRAARRSLGWSVARPARRPTYFACPTRVGYRGAAPAGEGGVGVRPPKGPLRSYRCLTACGRPSRSNPRRRPKRRRAAEHRIDRHAQLPAPRPQIPPRERILVDRIALVETATAECRPRSRSERDAQQEGACRPRWSDVASSSGGVRTRRTMPPRMAKATATAAWRRGWGDRVNARSTICTTSPSEPPDVVGSLTAPDGRPAIAIQPAYRTLGLVSRPIPSCPGIVPLLERTETAYGMRNRDRWQVARKRGRRRMGGHFLTAGRSMRCPDPRRRRMTPSAEAARSR